MLVHEQIKDTLKAFKTISLKEMDSVELMNRTDSKYVFNVDRLPELLNASKNNYKVLEINNERIFIYKTTYYDTLNYTLFNNHVTGKLNRHKIRHRTYQSTGVSYLEVKFKTNKNRTIKWRIKNDANECFDYSASQFLLERTKMQSETLNAVVNNFFKRITLVSLEEKTRITLDFNLSFTGKDGITKELPQIAIAEIKREGSNNSEFIKHLKIRGIRQGGFSKYCVGSALLYDLPKKNILKPIFIYIKRIENEHRTNALRY